MKCASVALLSGLLAAACSSTGGTVLGLFPAPKMLDGSIDDSVYTAEDGSFTVRVPHDEDSYEYTYMAVKEVEQPGSGGAGAEHYVSFGPAAICQGIWRLQVTPVVDPSHTAAVFDQAFDAIANHTMGELASAYHAPLTLAAEGSEPLAGHPARRRIYTQDVPAGSYLSNKPATLTHEVFFLDLGRAVVFVWVQRDDLLGDPCGLPAQAFAESVRLP